MSFLDKNNSEYITARLTQEGRNAIAKGDFKIDYFAVGDSEFNYSGGFKYLTGSVNGQNVFSPLDKDNQLKYPLEYLSGSNVLYGVPITGATVETVKNTMGAAGFVTGSNLSTGSLNITGSYTSLTGTNTLTVTFPTSGHTFSDSRYVSLVMGGLNSNTITGHTNSFVYKLVSVSGLTSTTELLTFDRNTPDLHTLSGNFNVIGNYCDNEFPPSDIDNSCLPPLPDTDAQHNPWTLNTIFTKEPIGFQPADDKVSGFISSKYVGIKEFLGYNSNSGQTFTDITGGTVTGTSYVNTYGDLIEVLPSEQNSIAIVHYSEIGDIVNDPDRFYKYDDYIAHTGQTDMDNFEIYIPFINYHRNTGTTIGETFLIDSDDHYIKSIPNSGSTFSIKYRYLIDEYNNKVGKVFVNHKTIVFDDQELVAVLDYKSNRKYTLPTPKLELTHVTAGESPILDGSTGQTLYITYVFASDDLSLNSYPCANITKISLTQGTSDACTTSLYAPSNVVVKFTGTTSFDFLQTSGGNNLKNGTIANKFYILAQLREDNSLPTSGGWKMIDKTPTLSGGFINKSSLTGTTITLTNGDYTNSSTYFSLSSHASVGSYTGTTNFGDEQPFPGSVKHVRATDIEEMKFLVNLPTGKFSTSKNPTYVSGNPMVTEIALLDDNKNVLVMGKTPKPIERIGGPQVFAVKLDF
jgi:hypothetical protein